METPAVTIAARGDGFRRCGRFHRPCPVEWPAGSWTEDQLARLQADPNLVVTVGAVLPAEAADSAEALAAFLHDLGADGIRASHMVDLGPELLDALDETLPVRSAREPDGSPARRLVEALDEMSHDEIAVAAAVIARAPATAGQLASLGLSVQHALEAEQPEGGSEEPAKPDSPPGADGGAADSGSRHDLVRRAVATVIDSGDKKLLTRAGAPRVPAVEKECGLDDVTAREIKDAMKASAKAKGRAS